MNLKSLNVLSESPIWRIWRGEDENLHQRYLIKELTPDARMNDAHQKRLTDEAEFLKRNSHQRLLTLHNFDPSGVLVMEDVQCTLDQLLERHGPLSSDLIAGVLLQCLEGLNHLHGRGIAHGMLSTQNLYVDGRGDVRFGDFLGYRFQSEKPIPDRWRKPRYQAPEVIDSHFGECGPASDLYCLGFIGIEMAAAGEFPNLFGFANQQPGQVPKWLAWHADPHLGLKDWSSRLPHLSLGLAEVLEGMIHKDVNRRHYRSATQIEQKLKSLGLHSRRVLPMFDAKKSAPKTLVPTLRTPQRIVGPTLLLQRRRATEAPKRFSPSQTVLVSRQANMPLTVPDDEVGVRHALLACQVRDWHVYDLYTPGGTQINGKAVTAPRPLKPGDELKFAKTAYLVDLEYEGTGIIPSFDLLKRLHVGAGGELYRAKWYRRNSQTATVALRIYPRDFQSDSEQIRRFLRAVPQAGRMKHPNIVRLLRGGMVRRRNQTLWYLAMENLPGGSLRDRLQRTSQPLPLADVHHLALDISAALKMAATKGLVHRNINPSCLLFDGQGTAKLGDFSLLRGEVQETMYNITRGKLQIVDFQYQAPEVLLGKSDVTPAGDLFSLAACLFEALTGTLPLPKQNSLAATITTMCRLDWPNVCEFNPEIPQEWANFLAKALARDPSQRFTSPDEFQQAVAALPRKSLHGMP